MPPKDINLSADERRVFDRLFNNADEEQLGVLTGDKAVPFFEASDLPGQTLGEIWALADDENTGFLTKEAFYVVCRLIGYAQRGQQPTEALVKKSGPLPYFKGMSVPGLPQQPPEKASAPGTPQRQPTAALSNLPIISPEDKAKYTRLFYNSQPLGGLLDGEKAREIFTKSRLSNEKLGQIWNLADTQSRGALDATDFVIAMHLIHGSMNGTIPQLPDTLPISFYAQAAAGAAPVVPSLPTSPLRPQGTGSPMPSALYQQPTGSSLSNRGGVSALPLSQSQRGMSLGQSQGPGGAWAIDATEKAQSDQFFDMLDTSRQGILQGDVAVPFFVQSGLPEETLAQIWDLSDIRKEGSLTKEEFAVARRLVMDVIAGKPLPDQLDQSMIPPSLRATAQRLQNQPQQSEVERDLFSLMDDDEPSQLPPAVVATGASAFQPTAARVASPAPLQPTHTGGSSRSIPQPMQPMRTGTPSRQESNLHHRSPPPPIPSHRSASGHVTSPLHTGSGSGPAFFDATPTEEKGNQIPADSAAIGNLQNQVRETQRSVSGLRQERTALSSTVAKTEHEIDELKSALAQAKAAYDTESTNMTNLETRHKTGSEELKKLRQELITAESDLSALREQKSEIEQSILKDKEEIRGLKIQLKASNDEVATLKESLEKLRKDARQQKGMLVVNKKQLATSESEKEKVTAAIADEQSQARVSPGVTEQAHAVALPESKAASPAASANSGRSMNPFFNNGSAARVTSPLQASTVPAVQPVEDDPFGMSTRTVEAPQPQAPAQPTGFGFDDDFESAFKPTSNNIPQSQDKGKGRAISPPRPTAGQTDFDAAFADFDQPANGSVAAPTQPLPKTEDASTVEQVASQPAARHENPYPEEHNDRSMAVPAVAGAAVGALAAPAAIGATAGAVLGAGATAAAALAFSSQPEGSAEHQAPEQDASEQYARPVVSPSSMDPYASRPVPRHSDEEDNDSDDDDNASGELAPIRDVQQEDDESESDSDSEHTSGPTDREENHVPQESDLASPFASNEDGPAIASLGAVVDNDNTVSGGHSLESNPLPGAFPSGGSSAPSSVGDANEQYQDATGEQSERSASPAAAVHANADTLPSFMAGNQTGSPSQRAQFDTTADLSEQDPAARETERPKAGPTLGFDDTFDSPFKAMTPASHDSPAPAVATPQLPSYADSPAASAAAATVHHDAAARSEASGASEAVAPDMNATGAVRDSAASSSQADDFDDFEDLAPAQVEESGVASVPSAPTSARTADFDSNFEDDFGFDNQTFSHTNAQQAISPSKARTGSGFDDNFDSAFDTFTPAPAAQAQAAPPPLPARAPAVGFDDDFFSTSTPEQTPQSSAARMYPASPPSASTSTPAQSGPAPYDMPPQGSPPRQRPASPVQYTQPVGVPPQQQSSRNGPAVPQHTDADGDLPQVKELVGMGFNRKQAIAALEDNQFDLERAANALLSVNH